MRNKALTGGAVVLIIIGLVVVFCLWAGEKINDKITENNPNISKPAPDNNENPLAPPTASSEAEKVYLALGNPSNASSSPSNADNYLMVNNIYALSYNRDKGIPNWVAWRLTASDFGSANRQNDFRPDERLPQNWTHVMPNDYTHSGYDRGHLCPSADRSNSEESNSETFLMTNMTPQTHALNAGPWEKLETYSRSMVRRDTTLYIIAGQYGEKEKLKNKVSVPTNFWKIIVVLPANGNVSAINANTRIIAVDMPNDEYVANENWRKYRTTVKNIEQKTGYNFLSNIPDNLRNMLKSKIDTQ